MQFTLNMLLKDQHGRTYRLITLPEDKPEGTPRFEDQWVCQDENTGTLYQLTLAASKGLTEPDFVKLTS